MFDKSYRAKIIVVGEPGSGKTSILDRYINDYFSDQPSVTIGVDYFTKKLDYFWNRQKVRLQLNIWDTAGQEQFQSVAVNYYREADGAILVFDLTNPASFNQIVDYWLNRVRDNCGYDYVQNREPTTYSNDFPIFLVGNKVEGVTSTILHDVDTEAKNVNDITTTDMISLRIRASDFAEANRLTYVETSAKTGAGVDYLFQTLISRLKANSGRLKYSPGSILDNLVTLGADRSTEKVATTQRCC